METGNRFSNIEIYDGQFRGNILVLGRTDSGKTYFIQQLALNNFFGSLVKAYWVSGVVLSDTRKAQIEACFDCDIEFILVKDEDELNDALEHFKEVNEDSDENNDDTDYNVNDTLYGEKKILDNLIVMDDVSGIADHAKSNFANFLTVSRKYRYNVIYAFHVIKTTKEIWQKIISQTSCFNIFPKSTPVNTVFQILQDNCSKTQTKYIPTRNLWIFRLYTDLANSHERSCLTISCDNTNENGPGRYRTQANNPDNQVCYYADNRNDQIYKIFNSERIKGGEFSEGIHFKITKIQSKTNFETFSARNTLNQYGAGVRSKRSKYEGENDVTDGASDSNSGNAVSGDCRSAYEWKSAKPKYLLGR